MQTMTERIHRALSVVFNSIAKFGCRLGLILLFIHLMLLALATPLNQVLKNNETKRGPLKSRNLQGEMVDKNGR